MPSPVEMVIAVHPECICLVFTSSRCNLVNGSRQIYLDRYVMSTMAIWQDSQDLFSPFGLDCH